MLVTELPAGDVTLSLSCIGCTLLVSTMLPAPRTVCAASLFACSLGRPILTAPSASASIMTYTWQHRFWVLYCAWRLVILSVFLMVFLSCFRPHTHICTHTHTHTHIHTHTHTHTHTCSWVCNSQFQLLQCTTSAVEELSLNKRR